MPDMTKDQPNRRKVLAIPVLAAGLDLQGLAAQGQAPTLGDAARLNILMAESARTDRAENTLEALRHGDTNVSRFVDPLSDSYADERLRTKTTYLQRLKGIDRGRLGASEQIAYDVFQYNTEEALTEFSSGVFRIGQLTPLDPSFGLQVSFPDVASGAGAGVTFKTAQDYDDGLQRLKGFSAYLANAIVRLKQGLAAGYSQPKIIVQNVLVELDAMLALQPQATPFFQPIHTMPADVRASDGVRLAAAYEHVIVQDVLPGYRAWKAYLTETYLPAAREAPGLWAMKDGAKVYQAQLRHHITTTLGAEEIHQLGLSEVKRIRSEMEEGRDATGFKGDLQALFEYIRKEPRFYFSQPSEILDRFKTIEAQIWLGIPRLFNRKPKAPFEVRPLPSIGDTRGTGYYTPGRPDGSTPGVLYFNMSMLSTRPIPTMETLTLHEGIPGHHFQFSLAQENTALPDILRFRNGYTAYTEGWGLYSESLGKSLGMFHDPYQWFGHLDFEMLRAVRLVVDTGIHAKEWSRDKAIAFMTANTSMAAKDVRVEIDRYIAAPGQATAYKIGELKFLELRARAEKALGSRYDIRNYHDQVLMTGAMPLSILEAKIDRWIAAGGPRYA